MVYRLTFTITNPTHDLQAAKESLACYCEQFGDLSLVSITGAEEEQQTIWAEPKKGEC